MQCWLFEPWALVQQSLPRILPVALLQSPKETVYAARHQSALPSGEFYQSRDERQLALAPLLDRITVYGVT
jgi:hypothetical protein